MSVQTNPVDPAPVGTPLCSAKGCRRPATWALLWRNPRLHGPERTKRWLACDEHRESLSDFLARRDFPLRVEPVGPDDALPATS
jgi:hypothetical protein